LSSTPPVVSLEQLWNELWVSLASLLRSYTAVHGLSSSRQATVELGEKRILARFGTNWLELRREGSRVSWRREEVRSGDLELTETGRLLGNSGEVEMDMAAEAWARELMQ
jgi:transposase InsO family protein